MSDPDRPKAVLSITVPTAGLTVCAVLQFVADGAKISTTSALGTKLPMPAGDFFRADYAGPDDDALRLRLLGVALRVVHPLLDDYLKANGLGAGEFTVPAAGEVREAAETKWLPHLPLDWQEGDEIPPLPPLPDGPESPVLAHQELEQRRQLGIPWPPTDQLLQWMRS